MTKAQKGKHAMEIEGLGVVTDIVDDAEGSTFTISPG